MIIKENIKLSEVLWYKIGGITKYLIICESKSDINQALEFINKNRIDKVFVCGLGSNLVFTDDYFAGAVIQIYTREIKENDIQLIANNIVEAFSGVTLDKIITFALDHDLIGLEWAGGLPGTLGAAVRGNVGAYGGGIKDSLITADILVKNADNKYEVKTFTNSELNFSYRHSLVKDNPGNMIVISAKFKLKSANNEESAKAKDVYEMHIQQRKDRHPLEYPNCGSVFKNIREPEKIQKVLEVFPDIKDLIEKNWYGKIAAGYLIQRFGLQGYRVGDAQISQKHALFIVNLGQAKYNDVLKVIEKIQTQFNNTFGFTLEPEVEIVK